jgi:benzoyl-CoA 2,3-dioxygenase component B
MFVGETGIGRIVQRTCEAMKAAGIEDPYDIEKIRALGAIDLPLVQKKLNLHYSLTLDLFGAEISTNSANYFNAGLKGRFQETKIDDDHRLTNATYPILKFIDGKIVKEDVPALTALNMRLRDDYIEDCAKGVERWNKVIEKAGVNFRLDLSHVAFNRQIGEFKDVRATPKGVLISDAEWNKVRNDYLPAQADYEFLHALMKPQHEPGKFASWIAPPKVGIDGKPGEFTYVQIAA